MTCPSGATPNPTYNESVPPGEPIDVVVNEDGSTWEVVQCAECGAQVGDTHWTTESTNTYRVHWERQHPETLAYWREMNRVLDSMQ